MLKEIEKPKKSRKDMAEKAKGNFSCETGREDNRKNFEEFRKNRERAEKELERKKQKVKESNPQEPRLRTDGAIYRKFDQKEKNIINAVYVSIGNAIVNENMREGVILMIEKELTK